MVALPTPAATRNVVVLGASYAGARAAELLSRTLPSTHRVVVIDRQSHFNHLYLHPRVSVVPGHSAKTFIPYTGVIPSEANAANGTSLPLSNQARHVVIHAAVTALNEDFIELDRDLLEHERDLEGEAEEVEKLTEELEAARLDAAPKDKKAATRRLSWEYMIYALGCQLPPCLTSHARTKKDGVSFLEARGADIKRASKILIAGGGALGIQFASDIADLYNNPENVAHLNLAEDEVPPPKKHITLVHSRDRFLPMYKQEMHDEILRRLELLGVEVVLGERLQLPPQEEDEPGVTKTIKLGSGRELEYDLLMRCTGQKPNSQVFREWMPEALDEWGFIKIRPTLQVDVEGVPGADKLNEKLRRNVYSIGDVAAAGVIKAGHTGWNQAGVAVQNIMCCVETDAVNSQLSNGEAAEEPKLVEYERSPPQIKVTLGLQHSATEMCKEMGDQETHFATGTEGPIDGHYAMLPFSSPAAAQEYPAYVFDQLVSHDSNVPPPYANATFQQRYWYDASHYKPGGPVILLDGGETDGANRIPFLRQGILRILGEATGGIGIVLEHRYYGESFPVQNLSTDSLRFLDTLQSLHDSAHFARTVQMPGLEHLNLTAGQGTAWLYYGGSYAGAKAAFARSLFPDVFWGAIASSAVTTAIVDFWQYYEPIRQSAPADCVERLVENTALIDSLLLLNSSSLTSSLRGYFGLPNVTSDADFVNALALPLGSWQERNWDPTVGSRRFGAFCDALTNLTSLDSPSPSPVPFLSFPSPATLDRLALSKTPRETLESFSTYAAYVKQHIVPLCPPDEPQDACFGTDEYSGDGLDEYEWKSWAYQFCTEWGYFIGAAPEGTPSLVSRLLTPDYTGKICRRAFPPGKLNRVPASPNVTAINQWGSFDLSYPRLAFVDGSEDPWLYATPHSPNAPHPQRKDTLRKPFKLIKGGVHHWDENGLAPGRTEPPEIAKIHAAEVEFVQSWMREWKERGRWRWGGDGGEQGKVAGRWE
ncbi:hypothetical protein JCM10449v2_005997 [Rhodotorula kratochvilovae]